MENKDQNNTLLAGGPSNEALASDYGVVQEPLSDLNALSLAPGAEPFIPQEQPQSKANVFLRFARRLDVMLAVLLLVAGVVVVFSLTRKNSSDDVKSSVDTSFGTVEIPLGELVEGKDLRLSGIANVTINGMTQLSGGFRVAPSLQPTGAVAGQIYYDQGTNQLAYFNGEVFVFLSDPGATSGGVQSLGGATGLLTVGSGLGLTSNQLSNTGVLSVQGQTGAVSLTAGAGIVINGTNFSNSGIISVVSGSPNVAVANDGSGNVTLSVTSGAGTITSTGGTTGTIPVYTASQNIEDSIITQSGLAVTIGGGLNVTGAVTFGSPLAVGSGGTGAASLTTNGVLVGQGAGAITAVAAGGAGLCLLSTAGAPAWGVCPGGGGGGVTSLNGLTGALSIANATGLGSTITIDDASTVNKGIASFNSTNFTVSSGAVNTIQNINSTATPTFSGVNTNTITPGAALTVGISAQTALLQGSTTTITSSGGNNIILNSSGTIELQDNTNVAGNVTANGDLAANGGDITSSSALNITPGGTLTVGVASQTLTLQGGATSSFSATSGANTTVVAFTSPTANTTLNFPALAAGTYTICTTAGNCAGAGVTLQAAYSNSGDPEIVLDATRGALTLRDAATPLGANLLEVQDNGGGTTYLAVTSSGIAITGTVAATGNVNSASGTLQTNGTSRIDNTGNLINIASVTASGSATFQGGTVTIGATGQAGSLVLSDGSSNTGTLQVAALGQNTIYTLPDPGAGAATICLSTGNCAGSGGGITGAGTSGTIPIFTGTQTIADSIITQSGATVDIAGTLTLDNALGIAYGGTGLSAAPTNGQLLIGNGTGYSLATLTNSGGLTITNGAGSIGLSVNYGALANTAVQGNTSLTCPSGTGNLAGGGTSITLGTGGVCGALDTVANPNFATSVTTPLVQNAGLILASTGANTLQLRTNGSTRLTIASGGDLTATGSMTLQGGAITVGADSQAGLLTLFDGGAGVAAHTGVLQVISTLGQNTTYTLPDPGGASATICLTTGNCAGSGGGVTGTGTNNQLAKFTSTGSTIGDSTISDDGTTVATSVDMTIQGGDLIVGTTSQAASIVLHDGNGQTTTLQAGNSSGDLTFIFPTGAGGLNQCLKKGSGDQLVWDDCDGGGGGSSATFQNVYDNSSPASFTLNNTNDGLIILDNATPITGNLFAIQSNSGATTFLGVTASGVDISGTLSVNTITPNAAMTIGATGQNLTLQGSAGTSLRATDSGNTTTLGFATPTANATITLPNSTGTVCLQGATACGFINNGTSLQTGNFYIQSAGAANVGGIIRGAAGQTASLFQVLDGTSGLTVAQFTNNGYLMLGSDPMPRAGQIQYHDATISNSNILTVTVPSTLTGNRTITFPDDTGTVCINTGNCAGTGGSVGGTGTLNTIAKFTSTGSTIGDSIIIDNGTTVSVGGALAATGNINSSAGAVQTSGSTRIDNSGNLTNIGDLTATGAITITSTGATNDIIFNSADTIELQDNTNVTGNLDISGTLVAGTANAFQVAAGGDITTTGNATLQGGTLTVGTTSQTGSLLLHDGNGQTTTLQAGNSAGNLTFIFPTTAGGANQCLKQSGVGNQLVWQDCDGGAGGTSATFQTVYDNSNPASFTLNNTNDGLIILDNATPITGNLFAVQDNTGATTFLGVTASGVNVTGTATVSGNVNSSGGAIQTNSTTRIDNGGNLTNIGTLTLSGAISGGTTYSGSGNINTTGGVLQTASTTRIDNSGNLLNIGNLTATGAITISSTGATNDIVLNSADTIELQDSTNITGDLDVSGTFTAGTANALQVAANGNITSTGVATLQGGTLTIGTAAQAGSIVLHDGTSNTGTLELAPLGQNTVYTLPDPGVATAFICLNTGNCTGTGSANTLQAAYEAGNSITTSNNRDILFELSDTLADSNFFVDLQCVSSCLSAGRFAVQNAGVDVLTVSPADAGVLVQTAGGFNVKTALGNNVLTADTVNGRVGIALGGGVMPTLTDVGLEVRGAIRINDSGSPDTYVTPNGSNLAAYLNIQNRVLSAGNQLIAVGIHSSSDDAGRGITVLDDRASVHAPSISVISLSESQEGGFSWDGSDTVFRVKNSNASGSIALNIAGTDRLTATTTGITVNGANIAGTGALTIASAGAGNDVTVDGADQFIVQDASVFNNTITANSSILAGNVSTGVTGTTTGTGSNTTTLSLTSDPYGVNDVVFIDNAGQDYYTRITADPGTGTYTVSPAVTFENARTVTRYTIQNIGATAADYTTQSNRFFQGYFLGGVVTGAGSTTLSDGRLHSTGRINFNATDYLFGNNAGSSSYLAVDSTGISVTGNISATGTFSSSGTTSATAFQVQDAGAASLLTVNTVARTVGVAGNTVKVGNSTGTDTDLTVLQLDATTADPTTNLASINGGLFYNSTTNKVSLVENGQIKVICNTTDLGCGTGTVTLQSAYGNGNSIVTTSGNDIFIDLVDAAVDPSFIIDLQCDTSCGTGGQFVVADDGTDVFRIQPGASAGSAWFQVSSDVDNAFNIMNAAGTRTLFRADTTSTGRIYVGDVTPDTTGTILVLDTKTDSGDPTGVNGGMYYNSNSNTFRCYENGAWYDCLSRHKIVLGSDAVDNAGSCTEINTGLSFSVVSGRSYNFHAQLSYTAAATTTGSEWTVNGPSASFLAFVTRYIATNDASESLLFANTNNEGACTSDTPKNTGSIATIDGMITPSANGTFNVLFATEVNGSAVTLKAGSTLEWW